jgi:hypothetical protein
VASCVEPSKRVRRLDNYCGQRDTEPSNVTWILFCGDASKSTRRWSTCCLFLIKGPTTWLFLLRFKRALVCLICTRPYLGFSPSTRRPSPHSIPHSMPHSNRRRRRNNGDRFFFIHFHTSFSNNRRYLESGATPCKSQLLFDALCFTRYAIVFYHIRPCFSSCL